MKKTLIAISTLAFLTACGGSKVENAETPKTDTITTIANEEPQKEDNSLSDPFKDFPKEAVAVIAGQNVFTCIDIFNPGNKGKKFNEINTSFGIYKATETTAEFTKVEHFGQADNVPNYFVIPIKQKQTAKKGDIVLAPWKGGNMNRAIVIDDKNSAKPIVNFIDIGWTNPAKTDKGVGFGQEEVQLEENTFHVITETMEAGTTIAVKEGNDWKEANVLKISGDKVMIKGFGGKVSVVSKANCKAVEINPTCKAGDEVMAPWVGTFKKVKVIKIDKKYGRVYLDDPYSDDPLIVAFGTVTSSL